MDKAVSEIERLFRTAMRRYPATVNIVTTRHGALDAGMTATAVTSLSMEPPSLLVCVNRAVGFHTAIENATEFCVNVLREEQQDLAASFGGGKPPHERFADGAWGRQDGIHYLKNAQANIFCRRTAVFPYGTHSIVIGEVIRLLLHDEVAPLIYVDGRYAKVSSDFG
jgi:flavin reductase (DIM6/NTAB) family NADH-FMN oxidoreductase RutF